LSKAFDDIRRITFIRLGKEVTQWYNYTTGKFSYPPLFFEEKPEIWFRATVTLNFVVSHKYRSAILQMWFESREDAEMAIPEMRTDLIERIERYLGYKESLWWFSVIIGKAIQEDDEWHEEYFNVKDV